MWGWVNVGERNLPNVGMEALAHEVHKQGEHIPQHCYISHNHDPYLNLEATTSLWFSREFDAGPPNTY